MKKWFFLLLAVFRLGATEEAPWVDQVYEPVFSLSGFYQEFAFLNCHHHGKGKNIRYPGKGYLVDAGILFTREKDCDFQLETRLAETHAHSFAFDQFKETMRMIFFDDSEGDLLSLSGGISVAQVPKFALKDRSQLHRGEVEGQVHGAVGKEWSLKGQRTGRIWGLAAFGIANRGRPWLRGLIAGEYIFCFHHIFFARVEAEGGFGKRSPCQHHFRGYGNVAYRVCDASLRYGYQNLDGAIFSIEYLQRLFVRNAPRALKILRFELSYPISL